MRPLRIVWQRLVDTSGRTCARCGATQEALEQAVAKLKGALAPLGLQPTLEIRAISAAAFRSDPSASNRIWIADRSLEEWLGASSGSSQCCSVCGDSECRTVKVGDDVYEEIPEELILRAALAAAAQELAPAGATPASRGKQDACGPECCPPVKG
jgi:hypothetical protein